MKNNAYLTKNIPYTFVRVSAMRSRLIPMSEYIKMLKMDISAITRYLQEYEYKDSITKLSATYSGIELVDQALKMNQRDIFSKLIKISPVEVQNLINSYIRRIDIQNIKVVIRGIYSNSKKDEILALIQPVGKYDEAYYAKLLDLNTIENILKNSKIIDFKELSSALENFKKTNKLIELENELDKLYYKGAISDSQGLTTSGKHYKNFLLKEIDLLNIKNLIRMKREKFDASKIMDHMLIQGKHLDRAKLMKLASTDSYSSLIEMLKLSLYEKEIGFDEEVSVVDTQLKIDKYLMKSAILRVHQNPLSVTCVLAYLMNKIIEIRNIRIIVKAKHLGISEEYVEKNLLIV